MNYPKCTLGTIISPGLYWVVSEDPEHVSEIQQLELLLKIETTTNSNKIKDVNIHTIVAVDPSGNGQEFQRALVEKKIFHNLWEVNLIDHGRSTRVNQSCIKTITNKNFLETEPLSFLVQLYGLIPTEICYVNGIRKQKVCNKWTSKAENLIVELLKKTKDVRVQCVQLKERTVFGDLFVKIESSSRYLSLSKLLCAEEHAAYCEEFFLRADNQKENKAEFSLQMKNEPPSLCLLPRLNNKMLEVARWQRQNFGMNKDSNSHITDSLISRSSEVEVQMVESRNKGVVPTLSTNYSFEECKIPFQSEESCRLVATNPKNAMSKRGLNMRGSEVFSKIQGVKKSLSNEDPPFLDSKPDIFTSLCCSKNSVNGSDGSVDRVSCLGKPVRRPVGRGALLLERVTSAKYSKIESFNSQEVGSSLKFPFKTTSNERLTLNLESKGSSSPIPNIDESSYNLISKCEEIQHAFLSLGKKNEKHGTNGSASTGTNSEITNKEIPNLSQEEYSHNGKIKSENYWSPFVSFADSEVDPVETFSELPVEPGIITNLKAGGQYDVLSPVQRWAIPSIRKQHNVVVISSSKTGKTLSYLISVVDFILDSCNFDELPYGNGPAIVILCSSARMCESVHSKCNILLGQKKENRRGLSPKVKVVMAFGGPEEKNLWVKLTNGCDILISTPPCLVRLLQQAILVNLERLMCLVLDEIDVIVQSPYKNDARQIFELAQFSTRGRTYQKILCGEKWTPGVEYLVRTYMKSYALIIGSYSEAAVFARIKPKLCFVDSKQKDNIVMESITSRIGTFKILIICEKPCEAESLGKYLNTKEISSLVAHEHLSLQKIKEIRSKWEVLRPYPVMVCTDGILSELKIKDVHVLVHYSLPTKSKTNFFYRYSIFLNNYKRCHGDLGVPLLPNDSVDIILVDDFNYCQLPQVLDFIVRLGGNVAPGVLEKCEEIRSKLEMEKTNAPFCRNILAFGNCRKSARCSQRHALIKTIDSAGSLPYRGWVKFSFVKCFDATTFSAKLKEHIDLDGKKSKIIDNYFKITRDIGKYFREENRRPHGIPAIGDFCAVQFTEGSNQEVFFRAQVVEFVKLDKYDQPLEVKVRLVDLGDVMQFKITQLFELPENITKYPTSTVEIRAVGIQPVDCDMYWSEDATKMSNEIMRIQLQDNQCWMGKIVLALNGTLFLEPIVINRFLPNVSDSITDLVFQQELVIRKFAVNKDDYLPPLLRLCDAADIPVPNEKGFEGVVKQIIEPQWALFDSDFVEVKFAGAKNNCTVFLQNLKHIDLLKDMERACQEEAIGTLKAMSLWSEEQRNGRKLSVGAYCLALIEEKWGRGRIEKEKDESYFVYFVDHGHLKYLKKVEVIPISETLMLRLPCQIIECNLVGISREDSSSTALEDINTFCQDGPNKSLFAKIISKDERPENNKSPKYNVNILGADGMSLSSCLLNTKKVRPEESERHFLMDVENTKIKEEKDPMYSEKSILPSMNFSVTELNPEVEAVINSLEEYLDRKTDEEFYNEELEHFFQEFASTVFGNEALSSESSASLSAETENAEITESSIEPPDSSREMELVVPEEKNLENNTQLVEGNRRGKLSRLMEIINRRMEKERRHFTLECRQKVLTPQLLWCQDHEEIQIKIMVSNVTKHRLDLTPRNLLFRCYSGDQFYVVDLKLFGTVCPKGTQLTIKTFHVCIKLMKACGPAWPRLQSNGGRYRWISLDVESLADKRTTFSDRIEEAKKNIRAGIVTPGLRLDNIQWHSDSEDSLSDSDIEENPLP